MFMVENFIQGLNAMTNGCNFEKDGDEIVLRITRHISYQDATLIDSEIRFSLADIDRTLIQL